MLGLFGGYGFQGAMHFLTGIVHLPWIVGVSVILIEFFGALSLLFGFASRIWCVAICGLFVGIMSLTQVQHGFFMNWQGNQGGEGLEYSLLILGLAIGIFINGSGKFSVDLKLARQFAV